MMHEYLWCGMYGSHWIPCKVILERADDFYIRYHDDFVDGEVEATVDKDRIRKVQHDTVSQ